MKKILIFGINGFSGIHLWNRLRLLVKADIYGTYRQPLSPFKKKILKGCVLRHCDINNFEDIKKILNKFKPTHIYFLPALVTVAQSYDYARIIYQTNILGTANFLEAVVALKLHPRILISGSAEEYGRVSAAHLPIKEDQLLRPANPYGLSKSLQEYLMWYYVYNFGLNIRMTRTFHFAGPGQPTAFVVSDFASQVARIEAGIMPSVIHVGNLKAKRDFTDIRDVVKAYHFIMEKVDSPKVFNVCSGYSVSIQSILDSLLSLSSVKIRVQRDSKKMRRLDVPDFRGDNSRLKTTGWKPDYSLQQTLSDVLNEHRLKYQ